MQLTGYPEGEIIGRNCRFLQDPETDPKRVEHLRQGIDGEERVQVELVNYRKDGTAFLNHLTVAPVYDDTDKLTNYIGFQELTADELF